MLTSKHIHDVSHTTSCSSRRALLLAGVAATVASTSTAVADEVPLEKMPFLDGKDYGKSRMRCVGSPLTCTAAHVLHRYPDYTLTTSGLQYIDLREGTGKQPQQGATVLIDWGGYTIGYYGRPFEARNKVR